MKTAKLCALVSICIALGCGSAIGQVSTGAYRFSTVDSKGIDTINLGNLDVQLNLPVLNKPGRGIPFYYNLKYDNSIWYSTSVNGSNVWQPVQAFGWSGSTAIATGYVSYNSFSTSKTSRTCSYTLITNTGFVYHDPFGVQHGFVGTTKQYYGTCGGTNISGFNATARDSSGYSISVTNYAGNVLITSASGRQISPPVNVGTGSASAVDSNGNEITVDASGHFTDTTGVQVLTVAGGAPNPQTFQYKDTNGNPQNVTMNYTTKTVQTAFGCSGIGEYGPTATSLVSSVVYPDGSTYSFQYETTPNGSGNVTGRISMVTLPSGGRIQYTYSGGNHGINCQDGTNATVTRTLLDDPAGSTWTYSRTLQSSSTSQTSVTDGLGNQSTYNFVLPASPNPGELNWYETSRNIYQGTGGTALVSRQTCYNAQAPACTTQTLNLPITQIDTYETLNGIQQHGSEAKYNTYGEQTDRYDYDFGGASSRGSLLRHEVFTYGYSIVGLVTDDSVFDGSNNRASEVGFQYDTSGVTSTSGLPNHVSVSGPRGNLSQTSLSTASATSISTSATYEDTGDVLTWSIPNGQTGSLGYDATHSFATTATPPTPSSGVSLPSTASYDINSGINLSVKDPNNATTTVASTDSMLRPTRITFPDGGETDYTYTPTQISVIQYQSASAHADTEVLLDSYGRQSRVAVNNGQSTNPWYQQDLCYDADSRLSFKPYRYQGTGWGTGKVCSGAGDTYSYDALGRVTAITHSDSTAVHYSYLGRATQTTDENGVTRIVQVDGLGRQVAVCEISSNSSMPASGSPASCGLDISGTGFITSYTYDLANHKTTIAQGSQTRIFQTDWVGRPILIQEPESGTTTYSYSYNTTGLLATRVRPQANQPGSATTTTTTQYDTLGRVVSINYNDQLTPNKVFVYDVSAQWTNFTQTNLKGRLSVAYTPYAPPSTPTTGTSYSYDAMGRVAGLGKCLPSGCGNGAKDIHLLYTYDWLGNVLSAGDGGGVTTFYNGYSPANEVGTITSSLSDATHPGTLVSNVVYGPFGPQSWHLGNGLNIWHPYDALGRPQGEWVCTSTPSMGCGGAAYQTHGVYVGWSGSRVSITEETNDDIPNRVVYQIGYDEFNRMTSMTNQLNNQLLYTYVYDRYGNRWQQNVMAGSGPSPQFSFNPSTNQITNPGYGYDAAGNMTSDGIHSYSYDADGNLTQVDGGSTAKNTYDALNHRVRTDLGSTSYEFIFNPNGKRTAYYDLSGGTTWLGQGQSYWGDSAIEYYSGGVAHFQHQNWLGTERIRTTYNGGVESTFVSLPFGDGFGNQGGDTDPHHFANLDYDYASSTSHAQFRQYAGMSGRWMSPDPYAGSYDVINPQSMNRYSYVLNSPLSNRDPYGLVSTAECSGDYTVCVDGGGGGNDCSSDYTACVDGGDGGINCNDPGIDCYVGGSGGGGGGGGTDGGGSGNGASQNNLKKILECASKLANQFSIAGVLGVDEKTHPVLATFSNAFLGNTFSGISDTITHVATGNFGAAYGDFALGGTGQGLPVGSTASSKGLAGVLTEAGVNAVTGPGSVLSGVTGVATELGEEGLAGPFGLAKLGIDGAVYLGALAYCRAHP